MQNSVEAGLESKDALRGEGEAVSVGPATVEGIRGEMGKKSSEAGGLSDEDAISSAVLDCTGFRVLGLTVQRTNTHMILRGSVPSYHAKQVAQERAKSLCGDLEIQNEITVRVRG